MDSPTDPVGREDSEQRWIEKTQSASADIPSCVPQGAGGAGTGALAGADAGRDSCKVDPG